MGQRPMNAVTPTERVREHLAAFVALPEGFPLVTPMQPTLDAAHERRNLQRFLAEPEPITNFGGLT